MLQQLANGTSCQMTFLNAEYKCSVEFLLMVANEMKECKYYALSQDAGHRQRLEHLAKMISYPSKDHDGNPRIKNFCLDIDVCGKKQLLQYPSALISHSRGLSDLLLANGMALHETREAEVPYKILSRTSQYKTRC